ncbi:MAG: PilZ domain-containing protein [Syntrophobacterales bacterium]|nr:PilZ domain-containing protein [Syntrophobacterales bacterium]
MKKNVMICFRTSEKVRKSLQRISDEQSRSLSGLVESLISRYLQSYRRDNGDDISAERRQFERKKVSLPAFIGSTDSKADAFESGIVQDLSFSGIRFSLSRATKLEGLENQHVCVIFTLPNEHQLVTVKCLPQRVDDRGNRVQVSAELLDVDFTSCKALQSYLL